MAHTFIEGDKIVGKAGAPYFNTKEGTHWIVTDALSNGLVRVTHDDDYTDGGYGVHSVEPQYFELTNKENTPMTNNEILNNPLKALREQPDADTIILRKAGLENEDGTPTMKGVNAVDELLWKQYRAGFANKLRTAIKADEAAEAGEDSDEAAK